MKRYLITTSDQRSWKFDRPVLFLGEWCRRYDAKQVWEGMDALVARPFGITPEEKTRNETYIQQLLPQLLREVADALNDFHGCRHSLRYWHILTGHWLLRFLYVAFNRYYTLADALDNYELSGTTVFDSSSYSLATNDSRSLTWACDNDIWDHVLCSKILSSFGDVQTDTNSEALSGINSFVLSSAPGRKKSWPPRTIDLVAKQILPLFARERDAFIINSYLPKKEEIKLQISLGQCPQLWESPPLPFTPPELDQRRRLSIDASGHEGFERFVRLHIPQILPTCYLEGYRQLVQLTESLDWPAQPKFIFTSNNFDEDEVFKAWTGAKTEMGIPYFVGAHANYGCSALVEMDTNSPECVTADRFFTWGWADKDPKFVPAFVFKIAGRKLQQSEPKRDSLLLFEVHLPHRRNHWDSYFEFGIYQEEQFRFVAALPKTIQERLIVRLHLAYRKLDWHDEQRWRDRCPEIKVEAGLVNIRDVIAGSRLLVYSYDSTGIPEALASNIPVICFWHGALDHLLPSARSFYESLRRVGIVCDTPEQAAEMVALHWDNVSEWWQSRPVQEARLKFCERYAREDKTPVRTMKRLLTLYANQANKTTTAIYSQNRSWGLKS